jgi:hypothetical protein
LFTGADRSFFRTLPGDRLRRVAAKIPLVAMGRVAHCMTSARRHGHVPHLESLERSDWRINHLW